MQGSLDPLYQGSARHTSRRGGDDRSTARILSAAVVAGGLAFSASLYPVPGLPSPSQLWQQEQETIARLPGHIRTIVAGHLINLTNVDAPTLAHLVEILHNRFPEVRAEVFMNILANRSFPEVVRTFGILMAAGAPLPASAAVFAGGASGGGGGATGPLPLAELTSLLQLLLQRMPAYLAHEVIAALYPASLGPAVIDVVTQTLSLQQSVTTAAPPPEVQIEAPPAPVAPPPIDVAPPAPAAPEAPPVTGIDPAPPSVEAPPHTYESPVFETHSPVPDVLPEVVEQLPVNDDLGVGDDLGIGDDLGVGGDDEVTGSDDDSLGQDGDDGDESVGGGDALDDIGSAVGSDDSPTGADDSDTGPGISAALSGDDGRSALSVARVSASDGDDDSGSSGGADTHGNGSSAGASEGGHSGDAGSDGD